MNQPINTIEAVEFSGKWWVDIIYEGYTDTAISNGNTKALALKAAKRRLGRLLKDVEREIEKEGE